jgi:hypothetical protein
LSRIRAAAVTLALSLTSGVMVPLDWLGLNDAWAWLGITLVTVGRSRWTLVLPGLLTPWVDERYLIALPLAVLARTWLATDGMAPTWAMLRPPLRTALLATLPYLLLRASLSFFVSDGTGNLALWTWQEAGRWLPHVPRGWWVGARTVWLFPLAWVFISLRASRSTISWLPFAAVLGTLGVTALIACDLSRSSAVAWPAFLAGAVVVQRTSPRLAAWLLPAVLVANTLLPGGHAVDIYMLWLPSSLRYFLGS